MDEAERCHRLAILDHGRLVADGAPRELAEALPGVVLLIDCDNPRRAQETLANERGVEATAQIGASLRVLAAADAATRARIDAALQRAGIAARIAPTRPNLEDVFVAATRRRPRAEAPPP